MNNKLDYALYEKFELYANAFVEIISPEVQVPRQKEAMVDKIVEAVGVGATENRKQKKAALREKRKKAEKEFILPF